MGEFEQLGRELEVELSEFVKPLSPPLFVSANVIYS
jgi:hypothetical protein